MYSIPEMDQVFLTHSIFHINREFRYIHIKYPCHWRCLSSEELERMSVSAWLGVWLSSSLGVDSGMGASIRESTQMILRVGRSGSSDVSVRLHRINGLG